MGCSNFRHKAIMKLSVLALCAVLAACALFTVQQKEVYANVYEDNPFLDSNSSIYQDVYSGTNDDGEDIDLSDSEEEESGIIEMVKNILLWLISFIVDGIVRLVRWVIQFVTGLDSIDQLILGRAHPHPATRAIDGYHFELVKGNTLGVVGAIFYKYIRDFFFIFVAVKGMYILAGGLMNGANPQKRAAKKEEVYDGIFALFLVVLMPYIYSVALFVRDAVMKFFYVTMADLMFGSGNDNFSIVNIVAEMAYDPSNPLENGSEKFVSCICYGAVVGAVLFYAIMYVKLALSNLFHFSFFPIICLRGKDFKRLVSEWATTMTGNALVPFMDMLMLFVVAVLVVAGSPLIVMIIFIWSAPSIRDTVLMKIGLRPDKSADGLNGARALMMGMMRSGRNAKNAVSKIRSGNENRRRAQEEENAAKQEQAAVTQTERDGINEAEEALNLDGNNTTQNETNQEENGTNGGQEPGENESDNPQKDNPDPDGNNGEPSDEGDTVADEEIAQAQAAVNEAEDEERNYTKLAERADARGATNMAENYRKKAKEAGERKKEAKEKLEQAKDKKSAENNNQNAADTETKKVLTEENARLLEERNNIREQQQKNQAEIDEIDAAIRDLEANEQQVDEMMSESEEARQLEDANTALEEKRAAKEKAAELAESVRNDPDATQEQRQQAQAAADLANEEYINAQKEAQDKAAAYNAKRSELLNDYNGDIPDEKDTHLQRKAELEEQQEQLETELAEKEREIVENEDKLDQLLDPMERNAQEAAAMGGFNSDIDESLKARRDEAQKKISDKKDELYDIEDSAKHHRMAAENAKDEKTKEKFSDRAAELDEQAEKLRNDINNDISDYEADKENYLSQAEENYQEALKKAQEADEQNNDANHSSENAVRNEYAEFLEKYGEKNKANDIRDGKKGYGSEVLEADMQAFEASMEEGDAEGALSAAEKLQQHASELQAAAKREDLMAGDSSHSREASVLEQQKALSEEMSRRLQEKQGTEGFEGNEVEASITSLNNSAKDADRAVNDKDGSLRIAINEDMEAERDAHSTVGGKDAITLDDLGEMRAIENSRNSEEQSALIERRISKLSAKKASLNQDERGGEAERQIEAELDALNNLKKANSGNGTVSVADARGAYSRAVHNNANALYNRAQAQMVRDQLRSGNSAEPEGISSGRTRIHSIAEGRDYIAKEIDRQNSAIDSASSSLAVAEKDLNSAGIRQAEAERDMIDARNRGDRNAMNAAKKRAADAKVDQANARKIISERRREVSNAKERIEHLTATDKSLQERQAYIDAVKGAPDRYNEAAERGFSHMGVGYSGGGRASGRFISGVPFSGVGSAYGGYGGSQYAGHVGGSGYGGSYDHGFASYGRNGYPLVSDQQIRIAQMKRSIANMRADAERGEYNPYGNIDGRYLSHEEKARAYRAQARRDYVAGIGQGIIGVGASIAGASLGAFGGESGSMAGYILGNMGSNAAINSGISIKQYAQNRYHRMRGTIAANDLQNSIAGIGGNAPHQTSVEIDWGSVNNDTGARERINNMTAYVAISDMSDRIMDKVGPADSIIRNAILASGGEPYYGNYSAEDLINSPAFRMQFEESVREAYVEANGKQPSPVVIDYLLRQFAQECSKRA